MICTDFLLLIKSFFFYCLLMILLVDAMSCQRSEEFSLATSPSGKPEEGRSRCPYNPYNRNTAITVGKAGEGRMNCGEKLVPLLCT